MSMPAILFLDEPTQGLDPQNRANMWAYIRDLRDKKGPTLLLTTQNSNAISGTLGSMGSIHGELRWIFLAVAVLGIARTLYGLVRAARFAALDSRLVMVYSGLLDLQALYGIGLILYLSLDRLAPKGHHQLGRLAPGLDAGGRGRRPSERPL